MGEYERLTREQLAATLAAMEAAREIDSDALKRALHELQVHQVELEMQNRELREAQRLLEESRSRYVQLYDASPVGYVTLDRTGCLEEVNLTAHKLLAGKRLQVIGRPFIEWVAQADKEKFLNHSYRCRRGGTRVRTELTLQVGEQPVMVELCSVPDPHGGKSSRYLTAITDVTKRKEAEEALRQSHEMLRRLASHTEQMRESERARIAREIHDQLGASLTGIKMDLNWCHDAAATAGLAPAAKRLEDAMRLADAAIGSIRRICTDLRPSLLDTMGLVAALEWQAESIEKRTGIRCEIFTAGEKDLALKPDCSTALFRIVQEALTNVVRHSGASRARIALQADAAGVDIQVRDNGRGFVRGQETGAPAFGLLGMEERARAFGGQVSIESAAGQGTTVKVHIPRGQAS